MPKNFNGEFYPCGEYFGGPPGDPPAGANISIRREETTVLAALKALACVDDILSL